MLKDNFAEEHNVSEYETTRNKPMPSLNHSVIQANLVFLLKLNYDKTYLVTSELSLELSEWPSVPDISLLPLKKMDYWNDQIKVVEPPLCVIEILSPSQSITDMIKKAKNYFEHGVQSCWLVIPGLNNIYVFTSPEEYEMYKVGEMLFDKKMDIKLEVGKVFE